MKNERDNSAIIVQTNGKVSRIEFNNESDLLRVVREANKFEYPFKLTLWWEGEELESFEVKDILFDSRLISELDLDLPVFYGLKPSSQ